MRELRIYDPQHKPCDWNACMSASEYAVFHADRITEDFRNPANTVRTGTRDPTCLVFDSLPEAEEYCARTVEADPETICEIFDRSGRAGSPIRTFVNALHAPNPEKQRRSRWLQAASWSAVAVLLLVIDWRSQWTLMAPTFTALKFFLVALIFVVWNVVESVERRRASRARDSKRAD